MLARSQNIFKWDAYFVEQERTWLEALARSSFEEAEVTHGFVHRKTTPVDEKNRFIVDAVEAATCHAAAAYGYVNDHFVLETDIFQYTKGHYIPWHIDKDRHVAIGFAHIGDFSGGHFQFKTPIGNVCDMPLRSGDFVFFQNWTPDGKFLSFEHSVSEIKSGYRYSVGTSLLER